MSLDIQQAEREGIIILELKGRITVGPEATALRDRIAALGKEGSVNLILNLQHVAYIDSTGLGAPEGRYIAPANSASCIQVRSGDCAPRSVFLLAPWFHRFDIGIDKRFDVGGTRNIQVRFDLLNVFDVPNYNPVANPGTGATIFRTTSAYTDPSNTYDPGGRIGQLTFRFSW